MDDREDVAKHERLAEAAYDAMYEANARSAKVCYEDAALQFTLAIKAANRSGMTEEALRLKHRMEHVRNVYNHQFRGIG